MIHPDDRERVKAFVSNVGLQGSGIPLEYRIICKDGSIRIVWEYGQLMTINGANEYYVFVHLKDE